MLDDLYLQTVPKVYANKSFAWIAYASRLSKHAPQVTSFTNRLHAHRCIISTKGKGSFSTHHIDRFQLNKVHISYAFVQKTTYNHFHNIFKTF